MAFIDQESQVKLIQKKRQQRIEAVCKGWTARQNLTMAMLDKILVDDQHKILYCSIPKVGCTNWKKVFVMMSGKYNVSRNITKPMNVHHERFMRNIGLQYLSDFTKDEIVHRIHSYYKFLFVRNPLERILSAYRDKFTQYNKYTKYFQHKYGKFIIKKYRKNANKVSLARGHDVRFEEFVNYITDRPSNKEFNPHWAQYYRLCHPCKITYDFIGKMETLDMDAPYVMRKFQNGTWPFPPPPKTQSQTRSALKRFYRRIPAENISKLVEVYKGDFILLEYDPTTLLKSIYPENKM